MMERHDYCTGAGADGAPISPDAWKRAVYRAPPQLFSVEMLTPSKQGGGISYGMRICPLREDGASISSRGSNAEYDVWRRWEDCLWFQEQLELEYERMSRSKRKRLAAGKGVKKNGIYIQSDQAASFESLPPGPDPNSVTQDIHDFVPKLTKRGTLFRASQATIDQRCRELTAAIDGLFQENVPTLIEELRTSRKVTDFFGYWRRDFDLAMKQQKSQKAADSLKSSSRLSVSSSVFSAYFSASNPNLSNLPPSPQYSPSINSVASVATLSPTRVHAPRAPTSPPSRQPSLVSSTYSLRMSDHSSDEEVYPRRGSNGSTASSAGPPSPPGSSHGGVSPYIVSGDLPITFDHNPEHLSAYNINDRMSTMSTGLQSLPEDEVLVGPLSSRDGDYPSPKRRARKNLPEVTINRNAQVFTFDEEDVEEDTADTRTLNRLSWQTTTSTSTTNPASYLADLGMDFTLPTSPHSAAQFPRNSVASFASFMTDSSADAINPLSSRNLRRSNSVETKMSRASTRTETMWSDEDDDLLDTYFNDTFGHPSSPTPSSRPETPVGELPSSISMYSTYSDRTQMTSTTRRSSGSDTSSVIDTNTNVALKVMHNKSIILLRVHRTISFEEMRSKVYEKFATQEGVNLSESFAMAFVPPSFMEYPKARPRSISMSSVGAFPDLAHMRFISSQLEWEYALSAAARGKLTLRAIGDRGD